MKVSKLFDVFYGTDMELNHLEQVKNGINFVSRTSKNNGVSAIVKKVDVEPLEDGLITVAGSGSVLSSFVQIKPFYSGRDLFCLRSRKKMDLQTKLFYCLCLKTNDYRYSYGRQANKTLRDIDLPDKLPKWVKESFVYNLILNKPCTIKKIVLSKNRTWKSVKIEDIFLVRGTKTTPKDDLDDNLKSHPYITTQATNNGTAKFSNNKTENGNVLTIDSAVAGTCFYQPDNFTASDHVEKLIPKFKLNVYIAMFLVTIINKEQYRYSYGRKFNQIRIRNTKIKLPFKNNMPDWKYVEQYIKSIPYSNNLTD